jgi:hypothetical protein
MSENQMNTFMQAQREEMASYINENAFTGKTEDELGLEWITLYAKQFRDLYVIV